MAKEYIEREALLEHTIHISVNRDEIECVDIDDILDLPAADVVEVKHGYWVPHKNMIRSPIARNYDCSECGNSPLECGDFCNKCGARMDGKVDGE